MRVPESVTIPHSFWFGETEVMTHFRLNNSTCINEILKYIIEKDEENASFFIVGMFTCVEGLEKFERIDTAICADDLKKLISTILPGDKIHILNRVSVELFATHDVHNAYSDAYDSDSNDNTMGRLTELANLRVFATVLQKVGIKVVGNYRKRNVQQIMNCVVL